MGREKSYGSLIFFGKISPRPVCHDDFSSNLYAISSRVSRAGMF